MRPRYQARRLTMFDTVGFDPDYTKTKAIPHKEEEEEENQWKPKQETNLRFTPHSTPTPGLTVWRPVYIDRSKNNIFFFGTRYYQPSRERLAAAHIVLLIVC